MTLAPEHHIVQQITPISIKRGAILFRYNFQEKRKREAINAGNSTGVFTGAYALN